MKETERLLIEALKKMESENRQNARDFSNRLLRQEEATLRLKAEVDELRNSCGDAGKLYENLQSLLLRLNGGSANEKRTASA